MAEYLIAHDLGTSGDKAALFTTDGRLVKAVWLLMKYTILANTARSRILRTGGQRCAARHGRF